MLTTKLRVKIENETRVFLERLDFEIEMRVLQKSDLWLVYTLKITTTHSKILCLESALSR